MHPILRAGLAVALVTSVAACAHKEPPPPPAPEPAPAPPPPPPGPPTSFDGTYRGTFKVAEKTKGCRPAKPATVQISGGVLNWTESKKYAFSGALAQDGSFSLTTSDETLKGTATPDGLNGTLDGTTCHYTFSLAKKS